MTTNKQSNLYRFGKWNIYLQDDADGHLTVAVTHHDTTPVIDITPGDITSDDSEQCFRFSTEKIEDDYLNGRNQHDN